MVKKQKWIDRKFTFNYEIGMYPNIVERLRGTPARIEDKITRLSTTQLTQKPENSWSIQENIGHLISAEPLWLGRLDDFLTGANVLRPADMENKATFEADYNSKPIDEVLFQFRQIRETLVHRLDQLNEDQVSHSSLHPRLNQPMRVIDMVFFIAEHDDHHLLTMTELMKKV